MYKHDTSLDGQLASFSMVLDVFKQVICYGSSNIIWQINNKHSAVLYSLKGQLRPCFKFSNEDGLKYLKLIYNRLCDPLPTFPLSFDVNQRLEAQISSILSRELGFQTGRFVSRPSFDRRDFLAAIRLIKPINSANDIIY